MSESLTEHGRSLLERYAKTKAEVSALQDELAVIEDLVKEIVTKDCEGKYKSELGTLSVSSRKTYDYPDEIVSVENDLKEMKKSAQADGTATVTEKSFLTFRLKKFGDGRLSD